MKTARTFSYAMAMGMMLVPVAALAHPGHTGDGFVSGLLHPLAGIDHLLAMLAVGIWAARSGADARRWIPVAFVTGMLLGMTMGRLGIGLPAGDAWLATSVMAIGLLVAAQWRVAASSCAAMAAVLAILHGGAHGAEMAAGTPAIAYAIGIAITTVALNVIGIALADRLIDGDGARRRARWTGIGIGGIGALLLAAS